MLRTRLTRLLVIALSFGHGIVANAQVTRPPSPSESAPVQLQRRVDALASRLARADSLARGLRERMDSVVAVASAKARSNAAQIASAVAAWVALALSIWSVAVAGRSLALARAKALREVPRLVPYLVDGRTKTSDEHDRLIALLVSISNPSDSDNSVSTVELAVRQVVADNRISEVLLPCKPELDGQLPLSGAAVIRVPFGVAAHDTVAGWLLFSVPGKLVAPSSIEGYRLEIGDAHGSGYDLEPRILSEISDERSKSPSGPSA